MSPGALIRYDMNVMSRRGFIPAAPVPIMRTQEVTMIEIRKGEDRGHADHGWLKTWHSFSFADYLKVMFFIETYCFRV